MVWQPKRPDPHFHIDVVHVTGVTVIGLACFLGQRKLIPEAFVVYGCVGAVALITGYLMLKHLD